MHALSESSLGLRPMHIHNTSRTVLAVYSPFLSLPLASLLHVSLYLPPRSQQQQAKYVITMSVLSTHVAESAVIDAPYDEMWSKIKVRGV